MSFIRLPFLWSLTWGIHLTMFPPNPTPPESEQLHSTKPGKVLSPYFRVGGHWPALIFFWVASACESLCILSNNLPGTISTYLPSSLLSTLVLLPPPFTDSIRLTIPFLFGWSLVIFGTFIRLSCYRELGQSFTFSLNIRPDHKLITTGPYAYVRHPSYTGAVMAALGALLCYFSEGSWAITFYRFSTQHNAAPTPASSSPSSILSQLPTLGWPIWAGCWIGLGVFILAFGLGPRVKREDQMLKAAFGKEWEQWVQQVPYKFIPGLY